MSKLELVEQDDDVRRLGSWLTRRIGQQFEPIGNRGIGFKKPVSHKLENGKYARASEVGDVVVALERFPRLFRHRAREANDSGEAHGTACHRSQQPDPERIEAPDQDEYRYRQKRGDHHRHTQIGEDRQQEGDSVRIDDEKIEEARGHFQNFELEP